MSNEWIEWARVVMSTKLPERQYDNLAWDDEEDCYSEEEGCEEYTLEDHYDRFHDDFLDRYDVKI